MTNDDGPEVMFTVGIPAFKPQYLRECVLSVLAQTCPDLEVVVVNDASPHDLDAALHGISDGRLRYYVNEKGFGGEHVVGNWDRCLELARGRYFICMGDDDRLLPSCLADYALLIEQEPGLDVYHMRTEMIDEHGELIDLQEPRPRRESVFSMIWNLWKGRDQYIGDFLFRTSALRAAGGFYDLPYAWSSDKITTFILAGGKGIANTFRPGFQYRKHSATITNCRTNQRPRVDALLREKEWYETFLSHCPEPADEVDAKYLRLIRRDLGDYMRRRVEEMVYWDITDNPSHYAFWRDNAARYGLSPQAVGHGKFIHYKEKLRKLLRR